MPLSTGSRLRPDDVRYFDSLDELDHWAATPSAKLRGILEYRPRHPVHILKNGQQGKLLVCHDYKGGYTENPFGLSYTFNFWSLTDTFVYFSHHRVTIPPPGWITAAHRQGTRVLGTLIFEDSGKMDCLRLLVGKLPKSKTGPALPSSRQSIPLSSHYARLLADLAHLRGFDGYLLNFECQLDGGMSQTKALAGWITLLQSELLEKVGPHAQAIWYDSVIFTGMLQWQDRLDSYNLPFFLASSAFFTNYTWPRHYPSLVAQYFLSLDPRIIGGDSRTTGKSLSDIFMGVDVWGRGSHGGGGFGSYQAIEHVAPDSSGLSVALFGQGWTWESEQDKPGWTWEEWWDYERKLWVGSTSEPIHVPDAPRRVGEPECIHGPFMPISAFFPGHPPPNPADLSFYTTFCMGVGRAWFVDGVKVMQSENGWTDLDKQCSIGDMAWPRPSLTCEEGDIWPEDLPDTSAAIYLADAWNGGCSLRLGISSVGFRDEDAVFRCFWLPIQSLSITVQQPYEASAIFKLDPSVQIDIEVGLSVKVLSGVPGQTINVADVTHDTLPGGWTRLSIRFSLSAEWSDLSDVGVDALAAIGLIVGFALEAPTQPFNFSILLGQLNVFAASPPQATAYDPIIVWADFQPPSGDPTPGRISGILTWDTAVVLATSATVTVTSPDDPIPVWTVDTSERWFPKYLYFNIYAQAHSSDIHVSTPEEATWIGTTGWEGEGNMFVFDVPLPQEATEAKSIRFFIQGVTDHGVVLPWQQCIFVDTSM